MQRSFFILLAVSLIVLSMLATKGCREYRIDNCIEDGGTPNVPSWFVDDPADVRCIYGLQGE